MGETRGIRSFAGHPLIFRDNLLGVIGVSAVSLLRSKNLLGWGFCESGCGRYRKRRHSKRWIGFGVNSKLKKTTQGTSRRAEAGGGGAAAGAGGSHTCQPGEQHGRADCLASARSQPTDCGSHHRRQYVLALAIRDQPDLEEARAAASRIVQDGRRAVEIVNESACSSKRVLCNGSWSI